MCTAVAPLTPSSAGLNAFSPYFRAFSGREQVLDLSVDGGGVVERHLLLVLVEIVLRLLRHGERAGHRDLDGARGVGAKKPHVVDLYGMLAPDLAGYARHRV